MDEVLRFDSLAVHSGDHLTSPLAQLEVRVAALEGSGLPGRGAAALVFNSGRSALDALTRLLRPGDRVLVSNEVSSVAARNFATLAEFDVTVEFTELNDVGRVNLENSSLVFLESPTTATLQALDINRIARAAHDAGALVIVDNSLLTAYGCRPLEFGADAVVYSNAAALTGDATLALGVIVSRNDELLERLKTHRDNIGARPNAQAAGSALRGIKTLGARLERQFAAANDLARALDGHPNLRALHYPTLETPSVTEVQQLTRDGREIGGAVIGLSLWNADAARVFQESLRLFETSEWAGGSDATVCQPVRSSHRALNDFDLALNESLVRVSVGLEDTRDLRGALEAALEAITAFTPEPEPVEPDEPEGAPQPLLIAAPNFLETLDDAALERFERLREWRDAQAQEQNISKLLVLTNGVLEGIATAHPDSLEALGTVKGIGAKKLERYGDAILNVLRAPPRAWTDTVDIAVPVNEPRVPKTEVSSGGTSSKKRRRRRRKPQAGAST
jgi:cystathionine beta-lyase/cystathionine gamma-synthase